MSSKKNKTSILSILKGDFFSKTQNRKYVPFLFLIVSLLLINIRMTFHAESLQRKSVNLEHEVADLRLRYITTKSQLMSIYKRSAIEEMVSNQGLQTSLTPVYIIDVNEE
ncbi:FtsL-like putative cell division protein [Flavobacteriales bacterium]|nr:FtsL-like putative cell division protein [Flavobacteriales bacterium]